MNVSEVLESIAEKRTNIEELAKQYGVSGRTVQLKIKGLGFKWNAKERRYEYVGEGEVVEASSIEFETLFAKEQGEVSVGKKKAVASQAKKEKDIAMDSGDMDNIDLLLKKKKGNNEKAYRGYYIDKDVLAVIEQVDSGSRSELVNQCLRKVFKEKGLL